MFFKGEICVCLACSIRMHLRTPICTHTHAHICSRQCGSGHHRKPWDLSNKYRLSRICRQLGGCYKASHARGKPLWNVWFAHNVSFFVCPGYVHNIICYLFLAVWWWYVWTEPGGDPSGWGSSRGQFRARSRPQVCQVHQRSRWVTMQAM